MGINIKEIQLPCYGICVTIVDGSGNITHSGLEETCPYCEDTDCCYSCDLSEAVWDWDVPDRLKFNGAITGIMSMILAHACAGVDIESPEYIEGIETAIQTSNDNL